MLTLVVIMVQEMCDVNLNYFIFLLNRDFVNREELKTLNCVNEESHQIHGTMTTNIPMINR